MNIPVPSTNRQLVAFFCTSTWFIITHTQTLTTAAPWRLHTLQLLTADTSAARPASWCVSATDTAGTWSGRQTCDSADAICKSARTCSARSSKSELLGNTEGLQWKKTRQKFIWTHDKMSAWKYGALCRKSQLDRGAWKQKYLWFPPPLPSKRQGTCIHKWFLKYISNTVQQLSCQLLSTRIIYDTTGKKYWVITLDPCCRHYKRLLCVHCGDPWPKRVTSSEKVTSVTWLVGGQARGAYRGRVDSARTGVNLVQVDKRGM